MVPRPSLMTDYRNPQNDEDAGEASFFESYRLQSASNPCCGPGLRMVPDAIVGEGESNRFARKITSTPLIARPLSDPTDRENCRSDPNSSHHSISYAVFCLSGDWS